MRHPLLDAPITHEEIVNSNAKLGKSPGPDGLSNEFYKNLTSFVQA